MVKRLESSFHAFRLTLGRFMQSYDRMISEFQKGNVYISKKHINKVFDLLEEDDQEAIEQLLSEDKAERLDADAFSPQLLEDLQKDRDTLRHVNGLWGKIHRDPKWESFKEVLRTQPNLKKNKLIIFTESKETAEYLSSKIHDEVEQRVMLVTGNSDDAVLKAVNANFDANAYHPSDDYRILVSTEVLSEGVNLHRSNIIINYDIPWNPTRLIQRVGRVNRVDTKFDKIYTYNFFPTEESNDIIKLKEAAEAKIHAFIEMLGADARLLTEGEEIKSHDLFTRLSSKNTITGEDGEEDSELEYLTEIRRIRDENPDLFARIKRLPKKARSSRMFARNGIPKGFPALLTYFRQGRLDKFYVAEQGGSGAAEIDFFSTAKILKPHDVSELRQTIPQSFYDLLDRNKGAFAEATSLVAAGGSVKKGSPNDAYILNRLKAKEIRRYQGFTEDDEIFVEQVKELLLDGALPRLTTKKVAEVLKKESDPLRVLGVLRRDIPVLFFQQTRAQQTSHALNPREVILSSYLLESK
jgi:superfamily II DNA/RNA helicase